MLINKRTHFKITVPEEVLDKPPHVFEKIDATEWVFVFPEEVTDDQTKIIYKIGFLRQFLKYTNPTLTNSEIYAIINTEWQVFVGLRQMERRWKQYVNLFVIKEED